uniref:Interleukin 13 n=1 Tax=Sinocyclocheilus rhinocerous TaxID=307959 RepID=A0A673M3J2_9TELE
LQHIKLISLTVFSSFSISDNQIKSGDQIQRIQALVLRVISISLQREVLCQAEHELIKISWLSGAKYELFRFDKKLMRNLNMYNERHVKTCKPADEDQDPILLHAFLKNLLTCVKSAYSQVK